MTPGVLEGGILLLEGVGVDVEVEATGVTWGVTTGGW